MSANQAVFPIAAMARVLGVSSAGYYAWSRRRPSARAVADGELLKRIRTIHAVSRGTYGAPRVHAELRAEGRHIGRKRIARLMRQAGLAGVSRRKGPRTTQRDEGAVLDAFSRRIVGWAMANHLRAELVLQALDMAVQQRKPAADVI